MRKERASLCLPRIESAVLKSCRIFSSLQNKMPCMIKSEAIAIALLLLYSAKVKNKAGL